MGTGLEPLSMRCWRSGRVPSVHWGMVDEYMIKLKIVVEKHEDGYIAYPLGVDGAIVGEGDTFDEALADVKSAIGAYVEAFGAEGLNIDSPVLEAVIVESAAAV